MQNINRVYLYIIAFFVALTCVGSGYAYVGALGSKSRNAENLQRVDASTPARFNRSYQAIVESMSSVERTEFLKALSKFMNKYGPNNMDADAEFRKHINGKAVAVIVAEAKDIQ